MLIVWKPGKNNKQDNISMEKILFFDFLKPRFVNTLSTLFVLCLPLLREQYHNGQYVTWYRPVDIFVDYLHAPGNLQPLFLMLLFSILIYVIVSSVYEIITNLFAEIRIARI